MPPTNLSMSVFTPTPPLYIHRPIIAATLLLIVIILVAAANPYTPWHANSTPTAPLHRPVPSAPAARTNFYTFDLIQEYPHDPYAFTQRESFTHKMRDGWGLATNGKVLFGSDGTLRQFAWD
ncbi:hypothetical protein E2562_011663 [Oryza meyeriana var. granulata]|uniref:Uncharacterized protein n=1 Tax=Oryza meyeriana var. granulata TaxID=110450 RepID=A0A6G1DGY1_9ORYZ|nr:hypothetical protein E2562_011663 [Oryza meyeriana var. granulata]